MKVEPNPVITGLPVVVNMRIISDKEFTLDGDFSDCDGHTKLTVTDNSGNITDYETEMSCPSGERSPFDSQHKTLCKGVAEYSREIFLMPGEYKISVRYTSYGPYLDRYSETDQRPVVGIWTGELTSNEVKLTVKNPEGEDQKAFVILRPLQEELPTPENELPWFLKIEGEKILQDYPKSNYAAWVLWKNGENNYSNFMYRDQLSVEEEFNYPSVLQEFEPVGSFPWDSLHGIIQPWENLIQDFPNFKSDRKC